MRTAEIREKYLSFFESKGHLRLPSFSLIPENDPSLLFTSAGMAPLKPYFLGAKPIFGGREWRRITTCQKCLRVGDIENVGRTARHNTFFEMLGNFSFGDYFKKEAILWAWEFLTEHLKLDPERLWVTVYEDDDEAYAIWRDLVGVPEEKIGRFGEDENYWPGGAITHGPNGPSGPCSEIFYDRGPAFGTPDETGPNTGSGDRFVEIWNLVFHPVRPPGAHPRGGLLPRDPFLHRLAPVVAELLGDFYPEMRENLQAVEKQIRLEEERFLETLEGGLRRLDALLSGLKPGEVLPGQEAFRLYDTYGFPLDLTVEIAAERGYGVDTEGFKRAMEEQQERSRAAMAFEREIFKRSAQVLEEIYVEKGTTEFLGYGTLEAEAQVLALLAGDESLPEAGPGTEVQVVLDRTPFYAEGGGQIGDFGLLEWPGADRLRFDFTHPEPLKGEELERIELLVNRWIMADFPVTWRYLPLEEAKKEGAMALFGEKYGEVVRVVRVEGSPLEGLESKELCGGTHVRRTGEIGAFLIRSEEAVSAGVRRIEAVTGEGAIRFARGALSRLKALAERLEVGEAALEERLEKLLAELKAREKEVESLKARLVQAALGGGGVALEEKGGLRWAALELPGLDMAALRQAADDLVNRGADVALVLSGGQAVLKLSKGAQERGLEAGSLFQALTQRAGGRGGGKGALAQGGGLDPERAKAALPGLLL
jgi:alanyl-tRNA synthetase